MLTAYAYVALPKASYIWNRPTDEHNSLRSYSDTVTIFVGTTDHTLKIPKLTCHKALLSYFSDWFYERCYGSKKEEGGTKMIQLPNEDPSAINAMITWFYSGYNIDAVCTAEELWVLGEKYQSPAFANAAMEMLFRTYDPEGGEFMTAAAASYVDQFTKKDDPLRKFAIALIASSGPFCQKATKNLEPRKGADMFKADWKQFISEGGELIQDIAVLSPRFKRYLPTISPCNPWYHEGYFLPPLGRTLENFMEKRNRIKINFRNITSSSIEKNIDGKIDDQEQTTKSFQLGSKSEVE
ncbi:hypothetical protein EG329_004403 [Mollisiaceae sp. DMI_Dod_QoI]|nr:hypothetical protein EG329_004403 [Helotiales sp. DMI_Dod_QoI]